jgi:hypothetical protein
MVALLLMSTVLFAEFGDRQGTRSLIAQVPRHLHFVWLTPANMPGNVPHKVSSTIRMWKEMHPGWQVTTWSRDMVALKFPELSAFVNTMPMALLNWQSNLIRYHVLARYGGIYIDTDIQPLRQIPAHIMEAPFTVCEFPRSRRPCQIACNAVIGAAIGMPQMYEVAAKSLQNSIDKLTREPTGMYDLRVSGPSFWSRWGLKPPFRVLPSKTFYPCDWRDRTRCIARLFKNDQETVAMHTWKHTWGKSLHY